MEHAKEIVLQEVDNKQNTASGYKLTIKKPVDLKKSLDEYVIDLSDDEDGDLYEEFSNEVWDFLENLNIEK